MTIWLLAVLLIALGALTGYFWGAIRGLLCLIGVAAAVLLAGPLGARLTAVVPWLGFQHPLWPPFVAPVLAFLLVMLLLAGAAALVHFLVARHYRHKTDEFTYGRWDRLNRRTGLALGAALGAVYLVLLGVLIYVPGYAVVQLVTGEDAPAGARLLRALRNDMETTGLARLAGRYDPAADAYYHAVDILGLVYHNPALHSRLASYPPFLGLAEREEFKQLAGDVEANNLLQSGAPVAELLQHPGVRAVLHNPEIIQEFQALDLADLKEYLETGVSPRYRDQHILGRWRLNVRRSIAEMKERGDGLPPTEFNLIRKAMTLYLADMTLGFTTDNRVILKVQAKDETRLLRTLGAAAAAPPAAGPAPQGGLTARGLVSRAIPPPDPAAGGMSPEMRQRYGLGTPAAPSPPPAAAPAVVATRAPAGAPATSIQPLMASGEGSWSPAGDQYLLKFSRDGAELALKARVADGVLRAEADGRILIFDRI